MAWQQVGRWTCDRCGVTEEVTYVGMQYPPRPQGWGYMSPGSQDRDLCRDCASAYELWWGAPKAGHAVVVWNRVADEDWDPTKDGLA